MASFPSLHGVAAGAGGVVEFGSNVSPLNMTRGREAVSNTTHVGLCAQAQQQAPFDFFSGVCFLSFIVLSN